MKYAVIRTGGKQYKVTEGDVVDVERLPVSDGNVTFDDVLLYADGTDLRVGKPLVEGVSVLGVLVDTIRGEKIRVAKFKAKARYRRTTGHRQELSRVKIETIGSAKKAKQKEETKTEKTPAKKTTTRTKKTA